MPSDPERIYWDSCVFIDAIQHTPGRYETLKKIVKRAESGQIILVASTMCIAETVKLDQSTNTATQQAKTIREFFENDFISVKSVDRFIAEKAAEIARQHGLKPPDAIHVATALRWKCSVLHTYDGEQGDPKKMLAFNGKIGTPPLSIELPSTPPEQQTLI
ncbi:MAG: type II toxin-antitoxin system VapC family toxin [Planctomycetes bacterium]|nr:type II toxin-antitoxin system VapC family toxin [Planctomycetota bacterium]